MRLAASPESILLTPIRRTERPMVYRRFLKPPQMLRMTPPSSIPTAKAISAAEAWAGVPLKYDIQMRGKSVLIGI